MSLNVSNGGVPKLPVPRAIVSSRGMESDRQRDLRHHGGSDRALCLYSVELIERLQLEGHPIVPGAAGENMTISGLDWTLVAPGCTLDVGAVKIEVTSFTAPCKTILNAFADEQFTRISQRTNPGWSRVYARVLKAGLVQVGESVTLLAHR